MIKNIIVTDENGKVIGTTYPKRAVGLVKNGRAEYVSDCEIRLISAHAPTAEIKTEEQQMSKIIEFDARKFAFDKSCRSNSGLRTFITLSLGTAEVWEIGDHDRHRSQIISRMKLQRFTDYTFRFAMVGGHNENGDEVSLVNIFPENRWDDRLTYALDKDRYEPVISKRDKTGLLRVFELPFNSGNAEDWCIVITQEKAPAKFTAPLPLDAYAGLENMTYRQWINENGKKRSFFNREPNKDSGFIFRDPFAGGSPFRKLIDMAKQGADVDSIIEKARRGFDLESLIEQVKQGIDPDGDLFGGDKSAPDYVDNGSDSAGGFTTGSDGMNILCKDLNINESEFAEKLLQIGSGCTFRMNDTNIGPCGDRSCMMIGSPTSGSVLCFEDMTMTSYALSMIMAKVGGGCTVTFRDVIVTADGVGSMIDADNDASGIKFVLNDVTLPKQALDLIYSKIKTGSTITANNISTTFTEPETEQVKPESEKNVQQGKEEARGGYFFKDMLKSTFENAAESFNTFGEMMRKAENDISNVIGDIVNDKNGSGDVPDKKENAEPETDDSVDTDGEE
ncbi:hypothetical protein [Ruminococcus sp.]|uniref:hypothetical protein n=1 Tax=Ruminococcus sp. TaxID=41978 RepID=UPI002582E2C1|nr:hypothetical protein [Ruminococcus sp.]MCR5020189.1 hypothetical protein [Ruminococcus sp.]